MKITRWIVPGLVLVLGACVPVRVMTMEPSGAAYGRGAEWPTYQDQRWSAPSSLEEMEAMTSYLKQSNNLPGSNGLQLDAEQSGGTASIRTNGEDGMISIHPERMRTIPLNSWAFILGHELAHQTFIRSNGISGGELQADVDGARYATRAGYDPAAYLAWVMQTQGPGARQRVSAVGYALGVPPQAVWANLP